MLNIIQHIVDYIFPPSNEELQIRNGSSLWLESNCLPAQRTQNPFIESVFSYKDPVIKELIWQIKYKKNKRAIRFASEILFARLIAKNSDILLIPIPISKSRRRERGYNQCELLINEIMYIDKSNRIQTDFTILTRDKDIDKQTHKNRAERIVNTKHIFKVNKIFDPRANIIIIDDVSTTGSTLKEAREELLKAGYLNVSGLTIAH